MREPTPHDDDDLDAMLDEWVTSGAESDDDELAPEPTEPDALPSDISPSLIELERIPRRLWEQTLAPLPRQQRYWVAEQVGHRKLRSVAIDLAFRLDMAECQERNDRAAARAKARRSGYPLPVPDTEHAAGRSTTQVNMRLRGDDHARLAQAAAAVGLKPTTLARSLVLNGVAMMLRDHAAPPRTS